MAIQSFADRDTEKLFLTGKVSKKTKWINIKKIAIRKLDMLHYADKLKDLQSPPGNNLKALKANLIGFYSIRINDQWRILFNWTDTGPKNVRINDYHK